MWCSSVMGQGFFGYPPVSPFNGLPMPKADTSSSYEFLVGGHLMAGGEHSRSIYPAGSFLAHTHRMNANPVLMMILTGDLMRDGGDSLQRMGLKQAMMPLRFPVYNAPGEHDLKNRAAYKKDFKDTQLCFYNRGDCFLLLDTELLMEGKGQEILDFLKGVRGRKAFLPKGMEHLFVFSNRLLWAAVDPVGEPVDGLANTSIKGKVDREMAKQVYQAVVDFAGGSPIYWFSGDMGGEASAPLVYVENKADKIHYIASGLGDGDMDALIKVTVVRTDGRVYLTPFPLGPRKWNAVVSYTPEVAREMVKGDGKCGSIFCKKMLWIGIGIGVILGLVGEWLRRKRVARGR